MANALHMAHNTDAHARRHIRAPIVKRPIRASRIRAASVNALVKVLPLTFASVRPATAARDARVEIRASQIRA